MFRKLIHTNGVEFVFSATLKNVDRAAKETKVFLSSRNLKAHAFDVVLCAREALTNAVVRGSENDPAKTVTCTLSLENGFLVMEVEDEGAGFDWAHHIETDLSSTGESGRGLTIMRRYFGRIRFNEKGNKLTMTRRI